jgi:hypothetical protein
MESGTRPSVRHERCRTAFRAAAIEYHQKPCPTGHDRIIIEGKQLLDDE